MSETPVEVYTVRLERALHYLDSHMADELDIDRLADLSCFSRFHFQRVFAGVMGETPGRYLRRIRLESARRMIVERPARSLTDIAFACGFTSSTLFARMFKAEFRCSPRDIKKVSLSAFTAAVASAAAGGWGPVSMPPGVEGGVRVERHAALRIAFIRCTGYGPGIGLAYRRLFRGLREAGSLSGQTRSLGLSFDDPDITDHQKCRYYAGVSLAPDSPVPPGVSTMAVPAGKRAVLRFHGSMNQIDAAVDWLFSAWLPGSGQFPDNLPLHQFILKNPFRDGGNHFELDICLPLVD
jgi:AraC family transcriptional regulator